MSSLRDSQKQKIEQPPLIVATRQQSRFQRHGFRLLTVLFWMMFLLLFRVALTPLAWVVGAQSVYEMFSYKVEAQDFAELMLIYMLIVVTIGICLLGWARYNQFRFRTNERRIKFRPPVSSDELADFYQLSVQQVVETAQSRRIVLEHTEDGLVQDLEANDPLPALPTEPVPVALNCFRYGKYLLKRGIDSKDLRWSVYLDSQQLFYGGNLDSCLDYVDNLSP